MNPRHSQKREQEAWLETTVTMAPFEHHITSTPQVSPTTPKPDPQHVLQLPFPAKPEPRKAHPDSNTARKPHASSTGFDQCRRTSVSPGLGASRTRELPEQHPVLQGLQPSSERSLQHPAASRQPDLPWAGWPQREDRPQENGLQSLDVSEPRIYKISVPRGGPSPSRHNCN